MLKGKSIAAGCTRRRETQQRIVRPSMDEDSAMWRASYACFGITVEKRDYTTKSQSATIPVFVVVCLGLRVTRGRCSDGHLSLVPGKALEHMVSKPSMVSVHDPKLLPFF